jgi:hypothetical protein
MAVVAMVMAAMATPALAKRTCEEDPVTGANRCTGGASFSEPGGINNGVVGGSGGISVVDCDPELGCDVFFAGGGGAHTRFP